MKLSSLKIFIILIVSMVISSCQTNGWKRVIINKTEHPVNIAGFFDEKYGVTAGPSGVLFYTVDSGKTWIKGESKSSSKFGLEILNDRIAICCGDEGHNQSTNDGGKTWNNMSDFGSIEPDHCRFLSFIDEDIGWIASPEELACTFDSGKKWSKIDLPEGIKKITAIDLMNDLLANSGFLLDTDRFLYMTVDGGTTWTRKKINIEGSEFVFNFASTPRNAMHFSDSKNGIIIAYQLKPVKAWVAITTTNAAFSWEVEVITDKIGSDNAVFISNDGKLVAFYKSPKIFVYKKNE